MRPGHAPARIAAGAYILHTGLGKWSGDDRQAAGIHAMAASAYPFLGQIPPARFLRCVAAAEIATGLALLTPVVPSLVAGAALANFSAGLLGMYWRTPGMHKPGSIWPTDEGLAVSKDVWLLGIGLGLVIDGLLDCRRRA
ncbi:DoxX family membrane protein [Actinocorallia sp. API 0066]|uniref:DoxX family membrane protein n=1 Tax=Actinocorallia sp. API 0066 TaxID=2896846 RepID=UPI001E56A708|nr:DoxX family membrane protein [Actinocorallia sp. API 0066]MCD0451696.1 DoxX family membrane protein [Actinocorallia sp. API 0066]